MNRKKIFANNQKVTEKRKYRFLKRFLIKTLAIVGCIYVILTFIIVVLRMEGNTMSPFVRDGDLCIFYRLEDIYLNDVVVYENTEGSLQVGRIVAGSGQEIDFPESGGYEVDGYRPAEEIAYETYAGEDSSITYPLTLKKDEYFILNDFRTLTNDSREIGVVKKKQIKGKLLLLVRRRNF